MSYEVSWHEDGRIIYGRLVGIVTMDEITRANTSIAELLTQGTAPVHVIVDVTTMEKVPTDLNRIKRSMGYRNHPALGWHVLVGGNPLAHFLASIVAQMINLRFRSVSTMEEALAFLVQQDNTLASLFSK